MLSHKSFLSGRLWKKATNSSYSCIACPFPMCLCISSYQRVETISLPRWIWTDLNDLLWSIKCGRSDIVGSSEQSLKNTCSCCSHLLARWSRPASSPWAWETMERVVQSTIGTNHETCKWDGQVTQPIMPVVAMWETVLVFYCCRTS